MPSPQSPRESSIDEPATRRLVRRVVIYANPHKAGVGGVVAEMANWAEQRGIPLMADVETVQTLTTSGAMKDGIVEAYRADDASQDPFAGLGEEGLLVCLGGDGTLLHAVRRFWPLTAPVIGVNLGQLGFNASVEPAQAIEAIETWEQGISDPSERLVMRVRWHRGAEVIGETIALNDVVLAKHSEGRLIHLTLRQGSEIITTFAADGLIVSTPTGSTAYNLSAGGPIVHPNMQAFIATGICPHTLGARPVVLPPRPPLTLEFQPRHGRDRALLWIDGQEKWPIDPGDRVSLVAAENPLKLICWPGCQYFSLLRQKLHWGGQIPPSERIAGNEGYDQE